MPSRRSPPAPGEARHALSYSPLVAGRGWLKSLPRCRRRVDPPQRATTTATRPDRAPSSTGLTYSPNSLIATGRFVASAHRRLYTFAATFDFNPSQTRYGSPSTAGSSADKVDGRSASHGIGLSGLCQCEGKTCSAEERLTGVAPAPPSNRPRAASRRRSTTFSKAL
jgi:hypothetical protein